MIMGTERETVMSLKERVRNAEYHVDVDAVAEAIVRRITVNGLELRRRSLEHVLEAPQPGRPFGPHT
jgi:hypothetical protein